VSAHCKTVPQISLVHIGYTLRVYAT